MPLYHVADCTGVAPVNVFISHLATSAVDSTSGNVLLVPVLGEHC